MREAVVGLTCALLSATAAGADRRCQVDLDADREQFERLILSAGYARVRMYDESFEVLSGLLAEAPRPRTRASVHERLGYNHYQVRNLEKARFHLLEASAAHRPACGGPRRWKTLAAVAFEMGRHAEAAEYADAWQTSNEAIWQDFEGLRALTTAERLLVARYWSHVDRERALALAEAALADAAEPGTGAAADVDAATSAWIARLRQGEAPAEIPPLERPWLEQPAPSLSAAEAMRRVEVWQERRWRLTRPAEQPGGVPREEWVTDSWRLTPGAVPPPPPAAVPLALHPPSLPALAVPGGPGASAPSADEAAKRVEANGADPAAGTCPAAEND